ncbi:alpha/beta hydrolase [Kineobactrum salinum]|uniref:Alpha/beta hydrolase n=1 Tax=Kineobactrum salinum TaxID=2708301 RepID=A0A6C0U3N1_9GAMM|nr:alpha/beta fold hydrolase [Kineobactrum salinum]QIB66453.1 alpha/beta hydrolase [Kineobactrum salinum]
MKLFSLAAVVALGYVGVTLMYALLQRSLVYYPQAQAEDAAVAAVRRAGGEPWLDEEGRWLGWWQGDAGARHRVLVLHGNAGHALSRRYWVDLFQSFHASGPWRVHVLEYPGYGPRPGVPTEASLRDAALQALDHLQAEDSAPVLLLGESLGSGVAAHLVAQRRDAVAGLLLVTPFSSLVAAARHHLPLLPVSLLMLDRFDTRGLLADYEGPLVVVTGSEDRVVPEKLALPLVQDHRGPLLHWSQPGADHNAIDLNPRAGGWQDIDQFLRRHISD